LALKGASIISETIFIVLGFPGFSGKFSGIGPVKEDNLTDCYWLPERNN
jgi:hypothetical protein